jgi:hypothetical protein
MSEVTSPPGSEAAVKEGCTCPVLDNGRGRGSMWSKPGEPVFWISGDCPMHAPSPRSVAMDALIEAGKEQA